ncbi:hypothetical protein [Argonema antarcticum]|uniref:hypothetical protein n=1 Tax=Argonema antarcticum TaxID=2942763 RepID=UPI00201211C6|nr:hypothetical protein [Argonema antarcticum]MCL1475005.1 hypothetical protein [Argonema antarcticum A004/B2]
MTTLKERRKERLAALATRLKELLGSPSDSSLARSIGISLHVVHRMNTLRSSSLSEENTKQLCSFLGIDLNEFEQFLEGQINLAAITRNVKQVRISNLEESARALQVLKNEILPKLAFPDCLEALRDLQIRFWSLADDYVFVKRSLNSELTGLTDKVTTITELLQGQDLDAIAERVNFERNRLVEISLGEEPACEELTLLSASLGIPIKDLESLRERQFGQKNHKASFTGDNK